MVDKIPIMALDDRSVLVLVYDLLLNQFHVSPDHPLLHKYLAIIQEMEPGLQSLQDQVNRHTHH